MAIQDYLDFDLGFEPGPKESLVAHVVESPAGQATEHLTLTLSDEDLEMFLLRVGRPRRGVRRIDSPEMHAARDFGTRLYETLFSGSLGSLLERSIDEAERQGKGLRIRLRISDEASLSDLPWEYLYSEPLGRFVAVSTETPVVRYIELPRPIHPLTAAPPLRVLVVIASATDYPQLNVDREWQRLETALSDLVSAGLVKLHRGDATLSALQKDLRRQEYHVLHFIGHGGLEPATNTGMLIFEDERGRGRPVGGEDLGTLLHDHHSLRLVVLNSCEGARSSRTDPFSGTAQCLVRFGLPAVVAMQFEITDQAAITFAHDFYAAIADGFPVDTAVSEARKSIFAGGNDVEWGTPVLFMRSADGQLFDFDRSTPVGEPDEPTERRVVPVEEVPESRPAASEPDISQAHRPVERNRWWILLAFTAISALAAGIWWFVVRDGYSCERVRGMPQSECHALEDVYESTNGAGWTGDGVQRGWVKTNSPCASDTDSNAGWFGVDCENGHVSALFLAGHHLTGTLPPSIGDLTGLTTLHLYDNPSLNGEIPTSFTNLTNLEDCKLDNTTLTAANPTVETFLINHCNWPPPPASCENVEGIPVTECEALVDLYESTNGEAWTNEEVQRGWLDPEIPAPCWAGGDTGWFGVDCENGHVSALFLAGHHLTGTLPPSIGDLTGLTTLHLYDNPSLNGEIPTSFTNLTNLEDCKLDNTTLTAANPTVETFLINHCNW